MQTLWKSTAAYRLLENEGANNRFHHAYLLLTDDAANLRFALKTFAKLFYTDFSSPVPSAKTKRIFELIDAETFSDCLFYPEPDKKFAVADAEKLAEECLLRPVEGERKVFVCGDFAEANAASQNKLLKLLEQPPEGVVFLLGATSAFPVLPTVLSRVEKLEIPPFESKAVEEALLRTYGDKYAPADVALCAQACGGVMGTAQEMLEGGNYKSLLSDAFSLLLADFSALPALVRKLGETKQKKQLLSLLRILYRDAAVWKAGKRQHVLLGAEHVKIAAIAEKYSLSALLFAQERITQAERELKFNAVFPQCLETLLAAILHKNQTDANCVKGNV